MGAVALVVKSDTKVCIVEQFSVSLPPPAMPHQTAPQRCYISLVSGDGGRLVSLLHDQREGNVGDMRDQSDSTQVDGSDCNSNTIAAHSTSVSTHRAGMDRHTRGHIRPGLPEQRHRVV